MSGQMDQAITLTQWATDRVQECYWGPSCFAVNFTKSGACTWFERESIQKRYRKDGTKRHAQGCCLAT